MDSCLHRNDRKRKIPRSLEIVAPVFASGFASDFAKASSDKKASTDKKATPDKTPGRQSAEIQTWRLNSAVSGGIFPAVINFRVIIICVLRFNSLYFFRSSEIFNSGRLK